MAHYYLKLCVLEVTNFANKKACINFVDFINLLSCKAACTQEFN